MKVLLTGIDGFIGKVVAKELLKEEEVILTGLGRREKCSLDANIKYISADLAGETLDIDETYDVIVHVAANINMEPFCQQVVRDNCIGTQNILELAQKVHCQQIVYISSVPVVGIPTLLPVAEDHILNPQTTYHITKLFGEYLISMGKQFGIIPTILRITSPIGVGMPKNRMLPVFIDRCKNSLPITVYGTGKRVQNYVDVRDIANAIWQAITSKTEGIFNIGGKKSYNNREIAQICKLVTNSQTVITAVKEVAGEKEYTWEVSIKKAQDCFGYIPQYTLEDTIRWMIETGV